MAIEVYSGRHGSVSIGASTVCLLSSWELTVQQDIQTTGATSCSAGWQKVDRGNKKASGTITAKWNPDNSLGSIAINDALVTLTLTMDTGTYWSGSAMLGNLTHSCNIETGALQEESVTFESDGSWVLT